MTTADRRRAGRLMKDARTQALDLIHAREHAAATIALRSFVFIEEAARLSPKAYSNAEARRVLSRFMKAQAQFGDAGGGV